MITIWLFYLWQRNTSNYFLLSWVVEADRCFFRVSRCARIRIYSVISRRFQTGVGLYRFFLINKTKRRARFGVGRATGLCRCRWYLHCSFSGLRFYQIWRPFRCYRIACNLIFNQSRCSRIVLDHNSFCFGWRIWNFWQNCRPGFIHFLNKHNFCIGCDRFQGGYASWYLSKVWIDYER